MGSPDSHLASAANRAVVAAWIDGLNRHDVDAMCRHSHPDIVMEPTEYTAPPGTIFRGHSGVQSFARGVFERSPQFHADPTSFEDLESAIVVLVTVSREETEAAERAVLFELERGLVRRASGYEAAADAREAAARSTREAFHAVFDAAVEPILLLDDDGRIAEANRSAVAFLDLGDGDGRPAFSELLRDGEEGWSQSLRELRERGRAMGAIELAPGGRAECANFWATADFEPGHHLVLLREPGDPPPPERPLLTAREREILELLAHGKNARQIAQELVLSAATVRTHVQNAAAKLEASTRVQAIARAIARGEIDAG